jgi:hypothetical protein
MKYSSNVNMALVKSLFGVLVVLSVLILLAELYTGTIFIYQNIIGMLYGIIYLVLCLNFDRELHRLCEKTGLIV